MTKLTSSAADNTNIARQVHLMDEQSNSAATTKENIVGGNETDVSGKHDLEGKNLKQLTVTIGKNNVNNVAFAPSSDLSPTPSTSSSSPSSSLMSPPPSSANSSDPVHDLAPELLQIGWRKFWSKREGRPYFFNKITNESLWETPRLPGQPDFDRVTDPLGISSPQPPATPTDPGTPGFPPTGGISWPARISGEKRSLSVDSNNGPSKKFVLK